jgi:hypothetical protein
MTFLQSFYYKRFAQERQIPAASAAILIQNSDFV